ncbi:MAG: LptF/LptG family permease [Verrucomicrobiales bacterium]|nr:LptF/LptG family permease [Verrucomicrobiales bacterium]
MRLLDRYLFRELLVPLGFCLAAFLIFWITFDVFGQLDHFQDHQWTLGDIGEYYLLKLPELLNIVLPVSLLLALLYALTQHSRHNELIAMRAAGLSLWRICAPYFLLGLLFCGALSLINEQMLTDAPERLEQLERRRLQPATGVQPTRWRERVDFRNAAAGRQWSLGAFNLDTTELRQPRVAMYLPAGAHREIVAETAVWTNGYWLMATGRERIFRREEDSSPAEAAVQFFRPADMGGGPTNLAQWTGTPVVVSNVLVGMTNLSRIDEATKRTWTAQALTLSNGVMNGFRFTQPLELGSNRRILAKGGYWTNGHWRFLDAHEWIYRFKTDGDPMLLRHSVLDAPEFDESPSMIRSEVRVGEVLSRARSMRSAELPIRDILGYVRLHPQIPRDQMNHLQTQLYARIAAPWTCLVVVLIAVPFGAPSGRRNIFYGVAGSLAWGFLYFIVQRLGFALGQNGSVPPWLGAWLPNATFGTLGLWLMSRVR